MTSKKKRFPFSPKRQTDTVNQEVHLKRSVLDIQICPAKPEQIHKSSEKTGFKVFINFTHFMPL